MTRTNYIAIAAQLRREREAWTNIGVVPADYQRGGNDAYRRGARHAVANVALRLAHELEKDNPRFDRPRFLRAAGLEE